VLGGGGFIGSHLVAALLERTAVEVEAVDLTFDKLEVESPRLNRRLGSVEDAALIDQVVEASEIVISTTALCNPALYNTRPLAVIDASYSHLLPLVRRCAERGRWLVHLSTCEVYGHGELDAAGQPRPMSEATGALVLGPVQRERWTYACAKQLLERVIWAHGAHAGLAFSIVRPFNVIGPRMDFLPGIDGEGTPRVLASFMSALLSGQPMPLVDGGQARRSFVAVEEFVDGVLRLLERADRCHGEILNLGNPDNDVTMAELAARLGEAFRELRPDEPAPRIAEVTAEAFYGPGYEDTARRIPDIDRARALLDWRPTITLDEMLPKIVADYVSRYGPRVTPAGEESR